MEKEEKHTDVQVKQIKMYEVYGPCLLKRRKHDKKVDFLQKE